MSELSSAQRKELAKTLFLETGYTQQEIADRVGVDRRTIVRWVKEWQPLKISFTQTRDARIRSTMMQLNELDELIEAREVGKRYPSPREADTRRKLTADLEALEKDASVREIIDVSRSVLNFVRGINLEHAKMLSDYFDAYIKEKIKWAK